jgi:hypothetical protein
VRVVSFSAKFANCLFVELAGGGSFTNYGENAKKTTCKNQKNEEKDEEFTLGS